MKVNEVKIGIIQVIIGATMISFSPVFVKITNMGPTVIGFYRMFFGAIILLTTLKFMKGKIWLGKRHFLLSFCCAIVFCIDLLLWHRSIVYVGPGLATLLSAFQIFFLVGFGVIILKEKITLKMIIAILISFTGLYLIVGIDWINIEIQHKTGIIFGLISALCGAVYIILLRKIVHKEKSFSINNLSTLSLITLINMCIMGIVTLINKENIIIPDNKSFLALLGYGLFSQVLAWIFISTGLSKITPIQVGLTLILQPVLAYIWDIVFFENSLYTLEVVGVIMSICGIYIGTIQNSSDS